MISVAMLARLTWWIFEPSKRQSMTVLRELARCIRSHGMPGWPDPRSNGVPNWPDPNALGEFPINGQRAAQFKGSANRSPINACIRYVPGGNQYLRFVAASGPEPATGGGNG
jgi:hypothetical protein